MRWVPLTTSKKILRRLLVASKNLLVPSRISRVPIYYPAKFSQKLYENEENLAGGGGLLCRSITGYNGTRCKQGLVQKSRVKFPKKSKSQQKLILNIFICEFTTKDITKRMSLMQNFGRRWTDDKINTEWSTESHDLKQFKQTLSLQKKRGHVWNE